MRSRLPPGPRGRRKRTRQTKHDSLNLLSGHEALAVLRQLVSSYPTLLPDAKRVADALLATVSFTDIANRLFDLLLALDLDDLNAGPRADGYVEPSEAAWSAIERAVSPLFQDLERRVTLRHEDEAAEVCKGIVVGLYRAERVGFGLFDYAEDSPSELASQAVAIWRRRRRTRQLPRAFVEKFTPGWDWLLR